MMHFPQDFFWGAATAAYQVEGNNANADWWHWEKTQPAVTASGQACRHYELYREDFKLAKSLNHTCHRLSVEWSRIQPAAGVFDRTELDHYRDVIRCLRSLGLEPIVTLHHFTNPQWFASLGGWRSPQAVRLYCEYVRTVTEALAADVTYWVTINEPMVYVYFSFLAGRWPPQERSLLGARRAMNAMAAAHMQAYRLIHSLYRSAGLARPRVGFAHNMAAFVACTRGLRDRLCTALRNYSFNLRFPDILARSRTMDFVGVNYYTRHLIHTDRWSLHEVIANVCTKGHDTLEKNSLGWETYPQGLYDILVDLRRYRLPVLILENGICTEDDGQRWRYIRDHLVSVARARAAGVDVRGYLYWSLIDNFEWDKGFGPRFGLCGVDYSDFSRTVRESARRFAQVCATGMLEP